MAFISLEPELKAKSFTGIENKFITKYMPVLDAVAVKVNNQYHIARVQ